MLVTYFNPLTAKGIYIRTMNRLRISAHNAKRIYIIGTSPISLESVFDRHYLRASGLGIGLTRTKIWLFKCGCQLAVIDLAPSAALERHKACYGMSIVARPVD